MEAFGDIYAKLAPFSFEWENLFSESFESDFDEARGYEYMI